MNPREIADGYLRRGWAPIPIPRGSKGPIEKGWQDLRISLDAVPLYFSQPCNIGVLLGKPSGNLVDVDLDSPEAEEFAGEVLLATSTFGRKSKPRSHWLYVSEIGTGVMFKDPVAKEHGHKEMLCEIRSSRQQTVFPGSIHPSGEPIEWRDDCDPTTTEATDLAVRVQYLAAVCLLKRYWPAAGGRHEAAVPLIGILARTSMPEEFIARFVTAVNGGDSYEKHLGLARDAKARIEEGRPVQGIPTLSKVLGKIVTSTVLQWLGIAPIRPTAEEISNAAGVLTRQSSAEELESVLTLLRSARLAELECEAVFRAIKDRTGISLTVLRRQYRATSKDHGEKIANQAQQLVEIGTRAELWYDQENRAPFATIERDGHAEHYGIDSRSFSEWLSRSLYEKSRGVVPDRAALGNAIHTLSSLAQHEGRQHRTWLRMAYVDDTVYVDIGDNAWSAVRIDAHGWEVVQNPPVRFRRAGGHALPIPERGGAISELRPFVNGGDEEFMLIVGVLLNAYRAAGPFPILHIAGEKGSAKSTLLVLLRQLVDPAAAAGAGLPLNESDLVVVASNSWLVSGDNVSEIKDNLADALCRLSTGGGIRKRRLYTDNDDIAIDVERPVFLTGLSAVTDREDFLDRVVMVTLDRIEGNRKTEKAVHSEFASVHARILGALFDGLVTGLRRLPSTVVDDLPRMADFILFAEAAGPEYGWGDGEFLGAYMTMRSMIFEESALSDPVVGVISDWLYSQQPAYPGYEGNATELLRSLVTYCENSDTRRGILRAPQWPKSAAALSRKLRAARTGLAEMGVDAILGRDNDNKSRVLLNYLWPRQEERELPF